MALRTATVLAVLAAAALLDGAVLAASKRTSFQVSLTIAPQCVTTTTPKELRGLDPAAGVQVQCTGAIPYSVSTVPAAGASAPAPRRETVPAAQASTEGSAPDVLIILVTY